MKTPYTNFSCSFQLTCSVLQRSPAFSLLGGQAPCYSCDGRAVEKAFNRACTHEAPGNAMHWLAYLACSLVALGGVLILVVSILVECGWTLPRRLWLRYEYKRLETADIMDEWG